MTHKGGSPSAQGHGRLNRSAAIASVAVASILILMKIWGVWSTGSVAMLGSAVDTGLDLVSSMVTLYGVHLAAQPADANHRFGHGKAEAIAALVQVLLISLSAVGLMVQAVGRLWTGGGATHLEDGLLVSGTAFGLTFALLAYQRWVIARTGSLAIDTDHLHYKSDLALNVAVMVALLLDAWMGLGWIDPLFGIAIALWLGWGAWRASNAAINQLMDHEWPEDQRQRLIAIVARHPEFDGLHELRTRVSGSHDFVQFHLWVDPKLTVAEAHRRMEALEADLAEAFPRTEVLIHLDPRGHLDAPDERFEVLSG